jgi:hypothetical protein
MTQPRVEGKTIASIEALGYPSGSADASIMPWPNSDCAEAGIRITFTDGTRLTLEPVGWESEGISVDYTTTGEEA